MINEDKIRDRIVGRDMFAIPGPHTGEEVTISTTVLDAGDGDLYVNQEFTMQSFCNSASFTLIGAPLTPKVLRALADRLERLGVKN